MVTTPLENRWRAALAGRTAVISGGSRGIGLAIGCVLGRAGCNVALLAKTDRPHPKLEGTVHTAAAAIEQSGGRALAVVGDVRNEEDVARCVAAAAARFGGVDLVVNNASAIALQPVGELAPSRMGLMLDVNVKGTFHLIRACLPYLRASDHAHVLTLSPPVLGNRRWLGGLAPYTLTKMGMTMLTLGLAQDEAGSGVAANCLWPRTLIATAAVQNLLGGDEKIERARTPAIMADAAATILAADPGVQTGRALIDDEVLLGAGVTDLDAYRVVPHGSLELDLFVDHELDPEALPCGDPLRRRSL
jgi:citronellol/citronellal dehydrogenase